LLFKSFSKKFIIGFGRLAHRFEPFLPSRPQ
jgi:hypothetical protein